MWEIRIAILCAVLSFLATPGAAATKIALEGETAPGSNGTFLRFSRSGHLTETGKVFFFALTDATPPAGGTTVGCIFRYDVDGGNGTAVLCDGDSMNLPGGDSWVDVKGSSLDVNGAGDLVFSGQYLDTLGATQFGTFHLSEAGALTDLGYLGSDLQLNDAGDVLAGGLDLVITSVGGSPTTILIEDQILPDEPGNYAAGIWEALGPNGEVAVSVRATPMPSGPPFTDWIVYLWDSGVFTRIGTNSFGPFTASGVDAVIPHFTPGGRLLAFVERNFFTEGIVEWDGTAWVPVVLPRPGEQILGGTFPMDTAGLSRMSFTTFDAAGVSSVCTVLGTSPGAREPMLRSGDVLPDGIVSSSGAARISTTHWALRVTLDSLDGPQGIFVGRTNKVPSLGAPAGVVLATLLALGGALLLRRETR